jgi:hypothetical protein
MQSHRRPQRTLSNKAHSDNFNPADALESLARIYTLVSRVANDATAAATYGDKLITALSTHLSKPTNDT